MLDITDTTGVTKLYGEQQTFGLEAAAAYLNEKGGIDGREVAVKQVSSNGEPTLAVTEAINELSSDPGKYAMVVAGSEGGEVAALIPVLKKFEVVGVSVNDGNAQCVDATECPNLFDIAGSNAVPEEAGAEWFKSQGFKHIGILEESIDFTQTESIPMEAALKKEGIEVTKVSYPSTAVDLTSEMSQLKSAGVEAVYAEALGPPAGYALKARSKLGWKVPVLFDEAGSGEDIPSLAPPGDLEEVSLLVIKCQNPKNPCPGLEQLKKSAKPGSIGNEPALVPGDGWDEGMVLQNMVEAAGSTEFDALKEAMENTTPKSRKNPLYITSQEKGWSSENHENNFETTADWEVIPVGSVEGAQDVPSK